MKNDSILVSKYVIKTLKEQNKEINHLKLQKILYYIQAWNLALLNEPLFEEDFEAWLHGPVIRKVWDEYKSHSVLIGELSEQDENINVKFTEDQEDVIEDVIDAYGNKSGYYLESLTHQEDPWKNARKQGENTIIKKEEMKKYYRNLYYGAE